MDPLKNELRTEPEPFRMPVETAFSCGPLDKITFESDSKLIFCVYLLTKQPWPGARDFLFPWTSRQIDVRIKIENDFGMDFLKKEPWALARELLFAWTSRQIDFQIRIENEFLLAPLDILMALTV